MGTELDIDDVVSGHPRAEKELKKLRQSPWIDIKERLPEESGIYMTSSILDGREAPKDFIDSLCQFNAEAKEGESIWQHSSGFYDNGITHWMDIPKPPEAV